MALVGCAHSVQPNKQRMLRSSKIQKLEEAPVDDTGRHSDSDLHRVIPADLFNNYIFPAIYDGLLGYQSKSLLIWSHRPNAGYKKLRKEILQLRLVCKRWKVIFMAFGIQVHIPVRRFTALRNKPTWTSTTEKKSLTCASSCAIALQFYGPQPKDHRFVLKWLELIRSSPDPSPYTRGFAVQFSPAGIRSMRPHHKIRIPEGAEYPFITAIVCQTEALSAFTDPDGVYNEIISAMPLLTAILHYPRFKDESSLLPSPEKIQTAAAGQIECVRFGGENSALDRLYRYVNDWQHVELAL